MEVYLREVSLAEGSTRAIQPWAYPWAGRCKRRLEDVKLLAGLHLGSVWQNGSCVGYVERPEFSGFKLDTTKASETKPVADVVAPSCYKVWSKEVENAPTIEDSPEADFLETIDWSHPLKTPCLMVSANDEASNAVSVVIPAWEAFRTYYGATGDLGYRFLRNPSTEVVTNSLVHLTQSDIDEESCFLAMRPGFKKRKLRRLAAQILTQPDVRRAADQLYQPTTGTMAPSGSTRLGGRYPMVALPFRGRAGVSFSGVRLPDHEGAPSYFAVNIVASDIPKPEGFRVGSYREVKPGTPTGGPEDVVEGEEAPNLDAHVHWQRRAPTTRSLNVLRDTEWLGDEDEVLEREASPLPDVLPKPTREPTTGLEAPVRVDLASGGGLSDRGLEEAVLKFRPGPEPGGDPPSPSTRRHRRAIEASTDSFLCTLDALEDRGIATSPVVLEGGAGPGASYFPSSYRGREIAWSRGSGRMALIARLSHPRIASSWVCLLEAIDAGKQHQMLMLWRQGMPPATKEVLELVLAHCATHSGRWFKPSRCASSPIWYPLSKLKTKYFNHTSVAVDASGDYDLELAARRFAAKISRRLPQ